MNGRVTSCASCAISAVTELLVFDSHLSFSDQLITLLLSLVHVSTTSVIFAAYTLFFTLIWLVPLAHLLFTPDLTTAIQCNTVFLKRS